MVPEGDSGQCCSVFLASSGRLSTPSLRWMGIYVFRFPLWVLAAGSGLQFALVNKVGRWLLVTTSTLAWWNAALTKFITCGYNSTLAWWNATHNSTLAWWNATHNSTLAWWNATHNSTLAWWNAAYNSTLARGYAALGRTFICNSTLAWWNAAFCQWLPESYHSTLAWWNAAFAKVTTWELSLDISVMKCCSCQIRCSCRIHSPYLIS